MANVARTVECRVFESRFGNDEAEMARIYGPYEDASLFFLSVDASTNTPVGALRVMRHTEAGFLTLNAMPAVAGGLSLDTVMEREGVRHPELCWDIGTVAVLPGFRRVGRGVSIQLYRAMYRAALAEGVDHLFSIIDARPYETMTRYLGIPFSPIIGTAPFEFEGSELSVAVHGYVPDFYPRMLRHCFTVRGWLARRSLWPLVLGTRDDAIVVT